MIKLNGKGSTWAKRAAALLSAIGVAVALGLVVNAYLADQKKQEIKRAAASMDAFARDWNADMQVASATSRIALAGPVMKLRDREEQLAKTRVPECLAKSKAELVAHVRLSIEAFTSFMADQEYLSSYQAGEAIKHLRLYSQFKAKCEASLK